MQIIRPNLNILFFRCYLPLKQLLKKTTALPFITNKKKKPFPLNHLEFGFIFLVDFFLFRRTIFMLNYCLWNYFGKKKFFFKVRLLLYLQNIIDIKFSGFNPFNVENV